MSRMIAVESAIMPARIIDAEKISAVDWNTFPFGVRIECSDGNWDILTRRSAEALVMMGVIPAP